MIDITNKYAVTVQERRVVIGRPMNHGEQLTPEDAMALAAWLATMADMAAAMDGRSVPPVQDVADAVLAT